MVAGSVEELEPHEKELIAFWRVELHSAIVLQRTLRGYYRDER